MYMCTSLYFYWTYPIVVFWVLPEAKQLLQATEQVEPLWIVVVSDLLEDGQLFSLTRQLLIELGEGPAISTTQEWLKQLQTLKFVKFLGKKTGREYFTCV